MRPTNLFGTLILVSALAANFGELALAAGRGKQAPVQPGGKATNHVSEKGSTNGNAQWSADPEKGWVRAERRHDLHEQRKSTETSRSSKGKGKGRND